MYDVKTVERRRAFVFDSWRNFAGFAYAAYLNYGRGVVVLERSQRDAKYLPYYLSLRDGGITDSDVRRCLQEYDPQTEIVVLLKLPDGECVFDRYSTDDPREAPREVFEKHQGSVTG
jgi:hypothetical protein